MKIKNIEKLAENKPVYNLTVRTHHNYLTSGGVILKNCDALRYYCVNFTYNTETPKVKDIWEEDEEKVMNDYINYGV